MSTPQHSLVNFIPIVDDSYCKKVSITKSLSMWFVNLVTVPSCDGRLILKKNGDINIEVLMS